MKALVDYRGNSLVAIVVHEKEVLVAHAFELAVAHKAELCLQSVVVTTLAGKCFPITV